MAAIRVAFVILLYSLTLGDANGFVNSGSVEKNINFRLGKNSTDRISLQNRIRRNVVRDRTKRWPQKTVYYQLDQRFTDFQKMVVRDATKQFHRHTCIRFVENKGQGIYLQIAPAAKGCWSEVGYEGVVDALLLNSDCFDRGIIMRHLLRVLGFVYEHQRPDRDSYVDIYMPNVVGDMKKYYIKLHPSAIDTMNFTYDYYSLLHFKAWENTIENMLPIMTPKVRGMSRYDLGKATDKHTFSETDLQKVNLYYEC